MVSLEGCWRVRVERGYRSSVTSCNTVTSLREVGLRLIVWEGSVLGSCLLLPSPLEAGAYSRRVWLLCHTP